MGTKKSVFASKAERANYEKLSRRWGEAYRIYHNLPFLHVFETDNVIDFSNWDLKPIHLTDSQLERLKKTSIDYTLCDENDCPILCVEFDGMQQGFNAGNRYYSDVPANPWRRMIMDLKLRVAHGSFFPFVVVGSVHFGEISSRIKVTIVDGI